MTRREARTPFVPPLRSDDDHSCFDDYDPKTPHPGEEFDRKQASSRSKSARRNKKPPLRAFKSFGKNLKSFGYLTKRPVAFSVHTRPRATP